MSFLRFFKRDFFSDKAFNYFFILCAALGIMGLSLVESFRSGVEKKISSNAKNFIASDLSISTRRPLSIIEKGKIEKEIKDNQLASARWIETYSLISKILPENEIANTKLANLNFVSQEFPFYGGVELEKKDVKGPGAWSELHKGKIAWISRDLAWELSVVVGEKLKIGESEFVVGGIIVNDQFSSFRGFNLAPKVFLSYDFMDDTDLVKFGSTITTNYLLKLDDDKQLESYKKSFSLLLNDKSIKVVSPQDSSEQISRPLNLLTDYLSLITLLTYILSLVGLYYFTQHYLSKRIKTLSIYRAIGFKNSFLFYISTAQLFFLTLISVAVAIVTVLIFLPMLQSYFSYLISEQLYFVLTTESIARILIISLAGNVLALIPLFWGAMQTPVSIVFQDLPSELKRINYKFFVPLYLYIVLLSVLLSHSLKVGAAFVFLCTLIVFLVAILFKFATYYLEKFSAHFNFINKHSARTLSRYFSSSFTVFICLFIGLILTVFILQIEVSLRKELVDAHESKRPDMFLFDIQDSQVSIFESILMKEKWIKTTFSPMIRGRLMKINEVSVMKRDEPEQNKVVFQTREDDNSTRMKNRGVNLSYRKELSWSEEITKGTFKGEVCNSEIKECEISLEEGYANRLGVSLGDRLTFEISGVDVTGIVSSFRKVKWTSFEPNFFILFQPGAIDEAPKTFLSSLKLSSFEEKKKVFAVIAKVLPSVSMIEVSELVKKISQVFALVALSVKFISILSLSVAMIVLIAVSFNHLSIRKKEMSLFYHIGVAKKSIHQIFLREFSVLLMLSFLLALIFGSLLTFFIMKLAFSAEAFYNLNMIMIISIPLLLFLIFIVNLRLRSILNFKNFI